MLNIYKILSDIFFILALPFWWVISRFVPKMGYGFKEKLGFFNLPITSHESPVPSSIWFYGISVGEVIALENLIKATKAQFPTHKIVLTTGTQTGQEIAHKKLGEVCDFITYHPFDFSFCINRVIKKLNPSIVIVAETELWPNIANILNKKNIPQIIVNGRISDRTYKSYKKLSFFFQPILRKYYSILTQSQKDNEKLISIGANPETTVVMGNLKFDIKKNEGLETNLGLCAQDKLIIAGSTHKGEDEIILGAFLHCKKALPNLKLLIAPRHPERHQAVLELIKDTKFGTRKNGDSFEDKDIILLDTMGELGKAYSICDIAFVGGSFNKTGGHNPLEATIFNKPVLSGASVHNFKDIYALLTQTNSAKIVKTPQELELALEKLLTDEEFYTQACKDCENVFEQNKGALEFVVARLKKVID